MISIHLFFSLSVPQCRGCYYNVRADGLSPLPPPEARGSVGVLYRGGSAAPRQPCLQGELSVLQLRRGYRPTPQEHGQTHF